MSHIQAEYHIHMPTSKAPPRLWFNGGLRELMAEIATIAKQVLRTRLAQKPLLLRHCRHGIPHSRRWVAAATQSGTDDSTFHYSLPFFPETAVAIIRGPKVRQYQIRTISVKMLNDLQYCSEDHQSTSSLRNVSDLLRSSLLSDPFLFCDIEYGFREFLRLYIYIPSSNSGSDVLLPPSSSLQTTLSFRS